MAAPVTPPVELSVATLPFAVVDVSMLAVEMVLLLLLMPRDRGRPTWAAGVLVASGLVGSAGALLAVFWAILYPNLNSFVIVFEALGISMGFPIGFWMITIIVYHDRTIPLDRPFWPRLFALAATAGEILMGLVFTTAADPTLAADGLVAGTAVSPWYLVSSAAVMLLLLAWIPLDPAWRRVLVGLAVAGIAAPFVPYYPLVGALLMSGAMAATYALIVLELRRSPSRPEAFGRLALAVAGGYAAMSAGGIAVAVVGAVVPSLIAFGTLMAVVMYAELAYLLTLGMTGGVEGTVAAAPTGAVPAPTFGAGAAPAFPTTLK